MPLGKFGEVGPGEAICEELMMTTALWGFDEAGPAEAFCDSDEEVLALALWSFGEAGPLDRNF